MPTDPGPIPPASPRPDYGTDKEIAVLRGHENSVRSAVFSPDGKRIVTQAAAFA